VYRDITFSELLGIITQAKVMEKQQDKNKYSLDDLKEVYAMGRTNATIKDFNDWLEQFKNK
jgi:predicted nucleic acid-binding protein